MSASKNRAMSLLGLMSVAAAVLAAPFARVAIAEPKEAGKQQTGIVECTITVGITALSGSLVQVVLRDPETIRRLIEEPLKKAKPDPKPAKYVITGGLVCKYADGTETEYSLFRPWGYCSTGSKYLIADLHELKKELMQQIKGAKEIVESFEDEPTNEQRGAGGRG